MLLHSATGITNCDDYYKVRQNNATITELKISFVSVFVRFVREMVLAKARKTSLTFSHVLSPVQTDVALLDVTYGVRLYNLLHVVGSFCAKFETGQTFSYVQMDPITPQVGNCWPIILRPFARGFISN